MAVLLCASPSLTLDPRVYADYDADRRRRLGASADTPSRSIQAMQSPIQSTVASISIGTFDAAAEPGPLIRNRLGKPATVIPMKLSAPSRQFPEGTDVKVKKTGDRYDAPGIGDDCRGLAVVLSVAKALNDGAIKTTGKVILVANVGEEGPGDLRGVRYMFGNEYKGKVDYFISVDGLGIHVTDRAVGSKRYSVKFTGPGGHSYGAFGMPSAIHAMGRAIANISDLQVPAGAKTTFNVGIVKGGTSVNTIAPDGTMDVDMRSESVSNLDEMDRRIQDAIAKGLAAENARWPNSKAKIAVKYDTIGIRPAGTDPFRCSFDRAGHSSGKSTASTRSARMVPTIKAPTILPVRIFWMGHSNVTFGIRAINANDEDHPRFD